MAVNREIPDRDGYMEYKSTNRTENDASPCGPLCDLGVTVRLA